MASSSKTKTRTTPRHPADNADVGTQGKGKVGATVIVGGRECSSRPIRAVGVSWGLACWVPVGRREKQETMGQRSWGGRRETKGRRKQTKLIKSGQNNRVCVPRAPEGRGLNWGGGGASWLCVRLPCASELREFSNGGQDVGTARARTKGARQSTPNTGARALGDRPLVRVGK